MLNSSLLKFALLLREISFAVIPSKQLNRPPTSRDRPGLPVSAMRGFSCAEVVLLRRRRDRRPSLRGRVHQRRVGSTSFVKYTLNAHVSDSPPILAKVHRSTNWFSSHSLTLICAVFALCNTRATATDPQSTQQMPWSRLPLHMCVNGCCGRGCGQRGSLGRAASMTGH